jgi:uncharacterized membrane protein
MSAVDRILTAALYMLGIVFVAGFVHILAILLMPYLAPNDSFARLAPLGKIGELVLLPRAEPGQQMIPFADPAVAQGFCLFDLDKGSLYLHGNLAGGGLVTLSFRTRSGRIFYGMTDKATQHGTLDIWVLTIAQRTALEADEDEDEQGSLRELRIVAPEKTGFVLISAFVPFPSARAQSEAQIAALSCAVEPVEQSELRDGPAKTSVGQLSTGRQVSYLRAN